VLNKHRRELVMERLPLSQQTARPSVELAVNSSAPARNDLSSLE
jgi:hypothetical protein